MVFTVVVEISETLDKYSRQLPKMRDYMAEPELEDERQTRSIPTFFTLKDVLTILVPVVAVAGAFFTYGTRITVLETDITALQLHEASVAVHADDNDDHINELMIETHRLETRVNMNTRQLEKVQEISRQLDKVANIQRERLEWANRELDELKEDIEALEK